MTIAGPAAETEDYASLPLESPRSRVFSDRLAAAELPVAAAAFGSSAGAELVAAVALVLARYSGTAKVSLGVCRGGLAVGISMATPADMTLADLVASVDTTLAGLRLEPRTFADKVSALGLDSVMNRNPLFGVMVGLDAAASPALRQDAFIRVDAAAQILAVDYNARLFRPTVVDRFLGHVNASLEAIRRSPASSVAEVRLLDPAERLELQSFARDADPRFYGTIWDHLQTALQRAPDTIVVEYKDEGWSLRRLVRRAEAIVAALGARAVPGARLGVALRPGPDQVAALLAAVLARGVIVPLDTTLPIARQDAIRADADLAAVITEAALEEQFQDYEPVIVETLAEGDHHMPSPMAPPAPDDPLYLLFTSGSTGQPKGVLVPHRTLANLVAWEDHRRPAKGKRALGRTSVAFDVGLQEIFATILFGGALVIASDDERADIGNLGRLLAEQQISRIYLPPVALHQLAESADLDALDLRQLEHVVVAGERLVISQAIRRFFRATQAALINQYGPTETHVATEEQLAGSPLRWADLPPIGRPIAGVDVHLLDQYGEQVPLLIPGEVYIGGVAPALGYIADRPSGSNAFMADPFVPHGHARLYRTGDRARWRENGILEFLGRNDDQVKIRGYRVELGDLEANAGSIPGVRHAIAKHWTSESWTGLALYAVLDDENPPSLAGLRASLRDRVPEYMLPPLHAIQAISALPMTASGKVDRARLPEPVGIDATADAGVDVPSRLKAIWSRRLGLAHVRPDEDFLDLGGHSLLAIQVVSEVNDAFDIGVPLSSLLRGTTLRQFTERVLNLVEARARPRAELAKLSAPAPRNGIKSARISTLTLGDLIIAAPSPSEARHLWREAFDERAYAPPALRYEKGSTIIDVGANVGIFSRFALAETGGCRIVAIEPAADLFECLKQNLAADSQVTSLQLGCGAQDAETKTFWYFPQVPAMSSFEPDVDKDRALLRELFANDPVWAAAGDNIQQALFLEGAFTAQEQSCPVRRLSTLIRQMDLARIDLLKIDVQRGESAVLAGIDAEHWGRIRQVVVELQDADGAAARTSALLERHGFDVAIATIPLHRGTDVRFVYASRS